MAMVINTNMASANAVRLLDSSSKEQSTSMERLTSGLRINSAADDAAGLAIATKMTSQISGTDVAIRNANDAVSMVQTIDGASEEVTSMLQRMRELGVQSMNDTYSTENRTQMNAEYQQLSEEINRVSETTKFNGINVMNSDSSLNIQAGWETTANDQIAIATKDMKTTALATFSFDDLTTGTFVTTGMDAVGDSVTFGIGANATDSTVNINIAYNEKVNGVIVQSEPQFQEALAYKINGNSELQASGISAEFDSTNGVSTISSYKSHLVSGDLAITSEVTNGTGDGGVDATNFGLGTTTVNTNGNVGALDETNVTTVANAKEAVGLIDIALDEITSYRAETGAKQNRLDHTISNLSSVNESITGARSRIQDADFATESANLARSQVLQQAGMSMLSQANANSQNVLSLLR